MPVALPAHASRKPIGIAPTARDNMKRPRCIRPRPAMKVRTSGTTGMAREAMIPLTPQVSKKC